MQLVAVVVIGHAGLVVGDLASLVVDDEKVHSPREAEGGCSEFYFGMSAECQAGPRGSAATLVAERAE
jgi:hypothetical protein